MVGIEKGLALDDEYRSGFAWFGAVLWIEVCEPYFSAFRHPAPPQWLQTRH